MCVRVYIQTNQIGHITFLKAAWHETKLVFFAERTIIILTEKQSPADRLRKSECDASLCFGAAPPTPQRNGGDVRLHALGEPLLGEAKATGLCSL